MGQLKMQDSKMRDQIDQRPTTDMTRKWGTKFPG